MEESKPENWEEVYEAALLETQPRKLPERIGIAVRVLDERLRELGHSPEENRERQWIEDGLQTLEILRLMLRKTAWPNGHLQS